jgi:hypothetical protein
MVQNIARVAALIVFAIIAYATLSLIDYRPRTGFVGLEREVAYLFLGFALAVAFPSRFWLVALALVAIAFGLEFAQQLTPDRHGRIIDAVQKLGGGIVGLLIGQRANRFL